MVILLKSILFLAIMILLPLILGRPFVAGLAKDSENFVLGGVLGLLLMFAVFYPLALFFTDKGEGLIWATLIWSIIIIAFAIFSIVKYGKNTIELIKIKIKNCKLEMFLIIAIILIVFQIVYVCVFWHSDADDAIYVGIATTSYDTKTINSYFPTIGYKMNPWEEFESYAFSPFGVFCAMMGSIISLHPAIIMHTLLPILFISLAYIIYYYIGKELFDKPKYQHIFLIIVALINIFGNWAIRSASSFMLFRIWQGKAIVCSILLPLLVYIFIRFIKEKPKICDWIFLFLACLSTSFVSGMGTLIILIFLPVMAIVYVIATRRPIDLFKIAGCAIPNILLGLVLFVI